MDVEGYLWKCWTQRYSEHKRPQTQSHGQNEGKDYFKVKHYLKLTDFADGVVKVYYHWLIFINFFKVFLFANFVIPHEHKK